MLVTAARLCRVSPSARLRVRMLSDAAKTTQGDVSKTVNSAVTAANTNPSSGGSGFGQRLASCFVGMGIGYSVSFYMLTEELEESNRIFSERLSKIEAALNIK